MERFERLPAQLLVHDPQMGDPRRGRLMPVFPTLLESATWEAQFALWEREMEPLIVAAREWADTL